MSARQHIWLSGASGFVGSRLLSLLGEDPRIGTLTCWVRPQSLFEPPPGGTANLRVCRCAAGEELRLRQSLEGVDTLVHLASPTGAAHPPATWDREIRQLTARLVALAREAGVRHFILISSIAAGYTRTLRYPYATSKKGAEEEAKARHGEMGLSILRPTQVFGQGSPVFAGLARMASLPLPLLFGRGAHACAPVARQDLCLAIQALCHSAPLGEEPQVVEGPEALPLSQLMVRIRQAQGRAARPTIPLPLSLILPTLWVWETLRLPFPFSLGQLATFRNPSVGSGIWPPPFPTPRVSLNTMIQESLSSQTEEHLDPPGRECDHLCRYLTGMPSTPSIRETYRRALTHLPPPGEADRKVIDLAVKSLRWTARMDTYTRFLAPTAILRYRISYLLAILETRPPHCRFLDGSDNHGLFRFGLGVIREGLGLVGAFFTSVLRLGLGTARRCYRGGTDV